MSYKIDSKFVTSYKEEGVNPRIMPHDRTMTANYFVYVDAKPVSRTVSEIFASEASGVRFPDDVGEIWSV